MTARIHCAGRDHAGRILNVSEGGFLLAPSEAFTPMIGGTVEIETAQLGAFQAHVIAISEQGLHLKISHASIAYENAVKRLAGLIRPWIDRPCTKSSTWHDTIC